MSLIQTQLRGCGILEGVLIQSPSYVTSSIRQPNDHFLVRTIRPSLDVNRFQKVPVLRGAMRVLQFGFHAIDGIAFSAQMLAENASERKESLSPWAVVFSLLFAFLFGVLVFVGIPNLVLGMLIESETVAIQSGTFQYYLVDGLARLAVIVLYLMGVRLIPDIRKVFEQQRASHIAIMAFEAEQDLTVESSKRQTSRYGRCLITTLVLGLILGTIASNFIFFGLQGVRVDNLVVQKILELSIRILVLVPAVGLVYEWQQIANRVGSNASRKLLLLPIYFVELLITRKPSDVQVALALGSLRQVLRCEKGIPSPVTQSQIGSQESENGGFEAEEEIFEISNIRELGKIRAKPSEFSEVEKQEA